MRRPPGYRTWKVRCDVHVEVDAGSLDEAAWIAMVAACGGRGRWWHRWTRRRRARRPYRVVGAGYLGAEVLDRRREWRHVDGISGHTTVLSGVPDPRTTEQAYWPPYHRLGCPVMTLPLGGDCTCAS